jgi:hypothetical protein
MPMMFFQLFEMLCNRRMVALLDNEDTLLHLPLLLLLLSSSVLL